MSEIYTDGGGESAAIPTSGAEISIGNPITFNIQIGKRYYLVSSIVDTGYYGRMGRLYYIDNTGSLTLLKTGTFASNASVGASISGTTVTVQGSSQGSSAIFATLIPIDE